MRERDFEKKEEKKGGGVSYSKGLKNRSNSHPAAQSVVHMITYSL